MDAQNRFQPPYFDLNNLDEDHEIVFDYDENGNLRRIRKVNRYRGFTVSIAFFLLLLAVGAYFLSGS
jgi:hypothetical protein